MTVRESNLFYVIGNYVLLHKKRSAKEAHLAEPKLVESGTARARKSPTSGLFVLSIVDKSEKTLAKKKHARYDKEKRKGAYYA